jgi:hypothetical protein
MDSQPLGSAMEIGCDVSTRAFDVRPARLIAFVINLTSNPKDMLDSYTLEA